MPFFHVSLQCVLQPVVNGNGKQIQIDYGNNSVVHEKM